MTWTIWQNWEAGQGGYGDGQPNGRESYRHYVTKAEAVAARVKLLATWRDSGSRRTAVKHLCPGREGAWTEVDGWDLQDRGYTGATFVAGFLNLFPAHDR